MEEKLLDAAKELPETNLDFDAIEQRKLTKTGNRAWRLIASVAACLTLLITIGFGSYVCVAEAKAYKEAVQFFHEHGLSIEGLSRSEIKAVYKDITTKTFTYNKTAEVIKKSLTAQQIPGYLISQDTPTPEELEAIWNYRNGGFPILTQRGIHYRYRSEDKYDPDRGLDIHDKSILEKYDGNTLLWSVEIDDFWVNEYCVVSDGVFAYGNTPPNTNPNTSYTCYAWMAKIDDNGHLLWTHMLDHGFEWETIGGILENEDGSYAVISWGDLNYFCLSQYTADGEETYFKQTKIGNYHIWNAARFGDGYLVQLGSYNTAEYATIVKVDREGNITEQFSYDSEDTRYFITDMVDYNGCIYLSAYAVPKLPRDDAHYGGRHELGTVLEYLFDNDIWEISSDELTPMVRDNYTAVLLVCNTDDGIPKEFYSVDGSLGGELALSDHGTLLWDVESIATTFFSPSTSAFTIGGSCYVFRHTFDTAGNLVNHEKTGELITFYK